MVRSKDTFWEYCEERGHKLYCNFCGKSFSTWITRFKYHLSREQGNDIKAYPQVLDDVQVLAVFTIYETEHKTVFLLELLKYHTRDSNIFDGVALGLLSKAHPRNGKYEEKAFHWFEWLPFEF
ncbi:hypothetical protein AMTRI_Chr08g165780 [Amborella trichopoda]